MVNCCVPHCTSYCRNRKYHVEGGDYISYHEFPCDLTLQEKWLKAISRKDFVVNLKSNSSRVCSKHFKNEDYINFKKRRMLKPGSIPSVFDDYPSYMQTSTSSRRSEPKKWKLEPSEVMEVQENDPDLTANEEIPSVFDGYPSCLQTSSSPEHSEHKKWKLEPSEMVEVQENNPDLTANEEIPSGFDGYSSCNQTSTSSPGCSDPKNFKLEPSETMEVQENYPDLTANEETATKPELTVLSMKKELWRKDFALEEKSKLLNAKNLEIRRLKRQLKAKSEQLQNVSTQIEDMEKDLKYYKNNIHHKTLKKLLDMESSGSIEPKQVFLLTQLKFMFNKSFRWPESVLEECILLQAVSPRGYRTLIERDLVTLPSKSTLKRYTGSVINETGA